MNEATLKNSLAIPQKVDSYCTSIKKKRITLGIFFFFWLKKKIILVQ